jgi:GTP:adenosylcobinamide-phosphate guanylyltransferase
MDADPTIEQRYDETGLRQLLLDATLLAERVAMAVETDNPGLAREYAEWTTSVYRRRRTPMDDLIRLCEGLRGAMPIALATADLPLADPALDQAIATYRWHRRIAGDARRRNWFLQLLYKGG